jgi:uncharacterized alpha-E superfamily protein
MLSSVAQRAYWTGRYLERAENTARILNVYTNLLLDLPKEAPISWHDMIRILGCSEAFEGHRQWPLETAAVRFMTSERTNPSSIAATIRQARENLRTLRDIVPKEAFEAVNELYLYGNDKLARATGRRARFGVLSRVIAYCQRSTGLFAGTMSHNQAYQFLKIGRNLERADMTTRIVDVAGELLRPDAVENEFDTTLWVNVLRTLSAYQAYRQSVRSRISPVRVLHFLLNDLQFPRARRSGDPRPPAHLHRLDARAAGAGAQERRRLESGLHARRDRQDVDRLPRRPVGGVDGGAGSGTEYGLQ